MKVKNLLLAVVLWQSAAATTLEQIPKVNPSLTEDGSSLNQNSDLALELADAQLFLLAQKSEINILKQHLKESQKSEARLRTESTSISVGSFTISKIHFANLSLSVGGFLLLTVVFLLWKLKRDGNSLRAAKLKLTDLEEEYDQHIKTALDREQKIRRQLQDEINRRKINNAS